jgi:FtsH-binding integral membrane protein
MNFKTCKEGFENGGKKTEHTINEKDETIFDLYMLVIGYIIIICFGVWFHKYFYIIIPSEIFNLSIAAVIVLPLILYSYYIFYQIKNIREHKSYEDLLKEAERELQKEEKISEIIPVILFGVAIVYSNIQKITKKQGLLKIIAPYLIFSLLFGTIVPNIVSYLILDHHDLHRVLIASDIDFVAVSIAFGLMITSLLLPFLTIY